jgi:hypothetical protein
MNRTPDVELVLREYLAHDGLIAPDYVLDVVEERIGRQRQQRVWPFPGRTTMNTQVKLIAALAAAIVLAVVGYNLLPGVSGPGSPTAAPTPTTAPTPTAVAIRDVPGRGGPLDPGQWRFHLELDGGSPSLTAVADIPAGWVAEAGGHGMENALATNSAPSGIAILFEMPAHGMFSDPCHWDIDGSHKSDQAGDVAIGSTVAELIVALRANTSFTSSAATDVALGGASGQQLELTFPADLEPATCDRDPTDDAGTYRVFPDTIYAQGKANIWRMFTLHVGAEVTNRIVVLIEHFPGTAPDKLAEAQAIVESMAFTP